MNQRSAIAKINKYGMLLVFPINNSRAPRSLWYEFFPRTAMRWQWDAEGDSRVSDLWLLMKKLSANPKVVYSKWFRGRATFFSRDLFEAMLCTLLEQYDLYFGLEPSAKNILETVESDSPLSTRDIKQETDLQGRMNEATYNRAMRQLFNRLLIVGFGEVDDGAFPSLAVGSTRVLYEDLWKAAENKSISQASKIIDQHMPEGSLFRKQFERIQKGLLKNHPLEAGL